MSDNALVIRDRKAVACWLLVCLALVALMVVVGGYTRLSGSGLSITEWKPVHGVIPPLSGEEWREEFAAYKSSPQYQKVNMGMTLAEFKGIYWPEYLHRLLGRTVGFIVLIPLLVFFMRGSISRALGWRLAGIFALGGLQGLIGWLMVKSGLVDDPRVSPIRLALHLSVAFVIFALLLWTWMDVIKVKGRQLTNIQNRLINHYKIWFLILCLQIIFGAIVAGLHAGLMYNTFPTMNGQWLPADLFSLQPSYLNLFENPVMAQFIHRWLAVLVVAGFAIWWFLHRRYVKDSNLLLPCLAVAATLVMQSTLGVCTLLHMVPLQLALTHQATALFLFGAAVYLWHELAKH